MIALTDGRRIEAKRNGFAFVTIWDGQESVTIDFAHAVELADALDEGRRYSVSSRGDSEWVFDGTELGRAAAPVYGDPHGRPMPVNPQVRLRPRGAWPIGDDVRRRLAHEIRRVVSS